MNIDPNSWKQQQRSVREKWSKLTDDDMTSIAGSREQLIAKIQKAYSCTRDDAERQVRDFERGGMESAGATGGGREQKGSEQTRSQPGGTPQGGGMRGDRPETSRGTQERAPEQTAE